MITNKFEEFAKEIKPVLVLNNEQSKVWLFNCDCVLLMDKLIPAFPDGIFDMIFADPPYFL
ncbi:MAG: hypothetical protein ACPMAG_13250 [Limisphaerales bacterium]|jgi:site-specific DNA-methyltransferase (adenine-specific)